MQITVPDTGVSRKKAVPDRNKLPGKFSLPDTDISRKTVKEE